MKISARITIGPAVRGEKSCIGGMRVTGGMISGFIFKKVPPPLKTHDKQRG
jgi:hypothetical protein